MNPWDFILGILEGPETFKKIVIPYILKYWKLIFEIYESLIIYTKILGRDVPYVLEHRTLVFDILESFVIYIWS